MKKLLSILLLSTTSLFAQVGGLVGVPISSVGGAINQIYIWSTNGSSVVSDINSVGSTLSQGQFLVLSAGVYILTNPIVCPENGGVIGAGKKATFIVDMYTNNTFVAPAIILQGNNNYVGNLMITNFYGDPSVGGIYAACLGNTKAMGYKAFTNAYIDNVFLTGGSDTFYIRQTTNCSYVAINSVINGRWDDLTCFEGTHKGTLYNCQLTNFVDISHGGSRILTISDGSAVPNFTFFDCTFALQGAGNGQLTLNVNGAISTGFVRYYQCRFFGGTSPIMSQTGGSVPVTLSSCQIDTSLIGDDIDPTTWINYGTNVINTITFGGDAADGLGPRLYSTGFGDPIHVSTAFALSTNGAPPTAIPAAGILCISNYDLYLKTSKGTTLLNTANH